MTLERKGLRFEVSFDEDEESYGAAAWSWELIGAEGAVCRSVESFYSEAEARSDIHKNKGRMKACGYAKVITITDE